MGLINFNHFTHLFSCITHISFSTFLQDLAVVVLLILIPLISPSSSKGGVIVFPATFMSTILKNLYATFYSVFTLLFTSLVISTIREFSYMHSFAFYFDSVFITQCWIFGNE